MQLFSITDDHTVLYDTPRSFAEIRRLDAHTPITAITSSPTEVVLCVLEGEIWVELSSGKADRVDNVSGHTLPGRRVREMEGVQIPAGMDWRAQVGGSGAKLLRVDSFHPGFDPTKGLMPPLAQPHYFSVADGQMLIYTDYIRGGVLNFRPGFAADKHFHQDADEIFWFFRGECRVETADGVVDAPAGTIIYTKPGEWHIIENATPDPLLMFVTVTPNIVPSHTFFDAQGNPVVRSWQPLRGR